MVSTTLEMSPRRAARGVPWLRVRVEEEAGRRLGACRYAFCFRDVSLRSADGVLIIRGRVPSFYLKQVLQTLLRGIDGVDQIDNQVDVVSSSGLSS
jgi:BON domain